MQALNAYCDDVASGRRPAAARLEFFVREADGVLGRIDAPLPAHGSLGPLFLAFGLITEEELRRGAGAAELGASRVRAMIALILYLLHCTCLGHGNTLCVLTSSHGAWQVPKGQHAFAWHVRTVLGHGQAVLMPTYCARCAAA